MGILPLRIPRALSLVLAAQLVIQVPAFAQADAAPGWNEDKDMMSSFAQDTSKASERKPEAAEATPKTSEANPETSTETPKTSEATPETPNSQSDKPEVAKPEVAVDTGRGADTAAGKSIAEIEKVVPAPTPEVLVLPFPVKAPETNAPESVAPAQKAAESTAPEATVKTSSEPEMLVVDADEKEPGKAADMSVPATATETVIPAAAFSSSSSFSSSSAAITLPAAPLLNTGTLGTVDQLGPDKLHQLGATVNSVIGTVNAAEASQNQDVVVVDCDENNEVEKVVEYENLPTDEGKTRIKSGARFPVVAVSQISSKTAKKGDPLEARLKYDLKVGDRLVAKRGAVVHGHLNYCLRARSVMHSLVSPERWYRNSGCLGVEFDEIIGEKGEHIPLVACPAKTARIVKNKGDGRELGVNHLGQVTGPWSQQLKYKAVRIGLNAAMAPAGAFSFGAMPVALGLIGAANPSFAFMKPVGTNVRHRRIKGFAWGFLSGIPGSWLIEDTVTKGQEAIIKPGDEFLAEFKEEFTGEPASEAELMPNAHAKVHGDVRTSGKKK